MANNSLDISPFRQETAHTLEPRQIKAFLMMLNGETRTKVSEEIGVSRRQLYRWEHSTEWQAMLRNCVREAQVTLLVRLSSMADDAVKVLHSNMTRKYVSSESKLSAARTVINALIRLTESVERSKSEPTNLNP
jgi:hypothetical protein